MCIIVLDGHENIKLQGDNVDAVLGLKPHFLIQTDGGCRNEGTTALGYVIYGIMLGYGEMPLD